ncbi:peptide-methionine (S)-S-oxide reductase MsrA [Sinorhizobium alkalisoli]|uniref:Peptide methionine sulfoxide reductase MsrA n=1 Tax=Sinorhizobium alkalisoli TaxID=1752398 RepID=A0A1E3VBM5_9HYPH|nr:peptide-methionine (S)-S-oxide reductase MsrA [Sinorhizobium alkalisoli]MCA1492616.1 peptide-methionine (S)-S-oxide reductase MsrA [Ensifer sp. NBAIM29]ODR90827.1 peptide-methionine (S)-S-oxide reductase [Sinorhizobium alkalisoli]QFI67891.1 Peptide methionine sulfoxide reductase MsrA [Sinorhizobium alkalisoli]
MLRPFIGLAALLLLIIPARSAEPQYAIFAGGCFWCVESDFDAVPGVLETISGYAGGKSPNPTYKTYEQGGHREVVRIKFDPARVSYAELVNILLRTTDPTDAGGQFCDRGFAYTTAIYALDDAQAMDARAEKIKAEAELGRPIVTPVEGPARFWPAEEYHQDYAARNPLRYWYYRSSCLRNRTVEALWGERAYAGVRH